MQRGRVQAPVQRRLPQSSACSLRTSAKRQCLPSQPPRKATRPPDTDQAECRTQLRALQASSGSAQAQQAQGVRAARSRSTPASQHAPKAKRRHQVRAGSACQSRIGQVAVASRVDKQSGHQRVDLAGAAIGARSRSERFSPPPTVHRPRCPAQAAPPNQRCSTPS
jgi:hypothetical protein